VPFPAKSAAEWRELIHRLSTVAGLEIVVPPLREHLEDLPRLIEHFLMLEEKRNGRRLRIDDSAIERWMAHDWPGNVRELENEIRRLALLGSGRIRATDLQAPPRVPWDLPPEAAGRLSSRW
jgi:DNA-binding NtrC family response regulator